MASVQALLLGLAPAGQVVVTVGVGGPGDGQVGFSTDTDPDFGAVSPGTYNGETLTTIQTITGSTDFALAFGNPALVQSFFTSVIVVDGTGTPRQYDTASADNFVNGGGISTWFWGIGNNDEVWTAADEGEARVVRFI